MFLSAAGIVVPIFHRFKVSPVLGYLLVGVCIGPYGLGLLADRMGVLRYATITDLEGVRALAELGVIFLLFTVGLELSLQRLWAMRRLVFGLGALQVLITSGLVGVIAWGFANSPQASIILGTCLSLSSTAIVIQLLIERRQLATLLGRVSFSVLLFQDLAVVPILFILGVFGSDGARGLGPSLLLALVKAVASIIVILLSGRLLLGPMLRLASATKSPELFMAVTLLAIIGTAAATGQAGLSMALGAFLAGLLIAECEYRHQVEIDIEPFKGLLLGLFFMSVGMGIDTRWIADQAFWIGGSVLGLLIIKATVTIGLCLLFGVSRSIAVEAGLLLGQGGEFAFVVIGMAMALRLVPVDVGQFMLIVTSLSMLGTPFVALAGRRMGAFVAGREGHPVPQPENAVGEPVGGHVLIAGFGRIGRTLGQVLDEERVPYIALDLDSEALAHHRHSGRRVYFGDAARPEMLRRARADTAQAAVITMDSPKRVEQTVRALRREWPLLPVFARARDAHHAERLLRLGATSVVQETMESSLQLCAHALEAFGLPQEAIDHRLNLARLAATVAPDDMDTRERSLHPKATD